MKFGLKVHHTDMRSLLRQKPDALEFLLYENDLSGEWTKGVDFRGPIVVHAPEKYSDGTLVDLGSSREDMRRRAVDIIKKTIDISVRLNASMLVCHPGCVYREPVNVDVSYLIDSMKELLGYSAGRVELLLENMPEIYHNKGELWSAYLFNDWREIRSVLQELDMSMCMDICHAKLYCNSRHIDFISYITVLKPFIKHIHISDALGTSGEGIQIGDGELNFRELYKAIDNVEAIIVPEIDRGFKDNGRGFKIARDRLVRLGYFETEV
ncbi:sugar phosphate isomerase/epimerase [Methanocella sp. CWC-04]|uniref:Sugar phosphate isomerase/epimerase n=2 Tax=Methanooceanicella nereidis TaxID=2052831 RepID=A0AAP2W648_9EURY|nr:sugar phosphate isomerase/epimerase [Methanocella sp. CWC-04]